MFFNLTGIGQSDYTYQTSFPVEEFWGWTLSSVSENPTIYQFTLNIESSPIDVVGDFKLNQNYQKYPSYNFGNMKYKKGKLSTIPHSSLIGSGEYVIDVELLNSLVAFINNKKAKVITLPSSESFIVCTMNCSYKYLDNIIETPFQINFDYLQIGNVV